VLASPALDVRKVSHLPILTLQHCCKRLHKRKVENSHKQPANSSQNLHRPDESELLLRNAIRYIECIKDHDADYCHTDVEYCQVGREVQSLVPSLDVEYTQELLEVVQDIIGLPREGHLRILFKINRYRDSERVVVDLDKVEENLEDVLPR
jgi:hypothetical protein